MKFNLLLHAVLVVAEWQLLSTICKARGEWFSVSCDVNSPTIQSNDELEKIALQIRINEEQIQREHAHVFYSGDQNKMLEEATLQASAIEAEIAGEYLLDEHNITKEAVPLVKVNLLSTGMLIGQAIEYAIMDKISNLTRYHPYDEMCQTFNKIDKPAT